MLRPTLLHSGQEVVRRNVNRRQRNLKLYEFGKSYGQLPPTGQPRKSRSTKSYSLSFTLQDEVATLSEAAIEQVMGRLRQQFKPKPGALIRS